MRILRLLAEQSHEVREKIQQLAMEILRDVDPESVSDDVYSDIPSEYMNTVIDEWKKGNPFADEVKEIEELFEID